MQLWSSIVLFLLSFSIFAVAQSADVESSSATIQADTLFIGSASEGLSTTAQAALIAGGTLFGMANIALQTSVYSEGRTSFYWNFRDDWRYANGADKAGHAYITYVQAHLFRHIFRAAGMDSAQAIYWGSGAAFANQLLVELNDAFSRGEKSPYLGFSIADVLANGLGAVLPILQHHSSVFRHFSLKMSLLESENLYPPRNVYSRVLHDYESRYHWLSVNVHGLLPEKAQQWYPEFVNIAVGHSVRGIVNEQGTYTMNGEHRIFLSLDWNTDALRGEGTIAQILKFLLSTYHFPAPGIQIYPRFQWFLGMRL